MTTKVEVDAHAGWPVKVTKFYKGGHYEGKTEERIVEPNTVEFFHIHDGMSILVEEMPRNNTDTSAAF